MRPVSITACGPDGISLLDIAAAVARTARQTLTPMWIEWKRVNRYPGPLEPASHDVCVPTAFALREALTRTIPEIRWKAVGGRPTTRTPQGGFRSNDGKYHPHLWVEGRCQEGIAVVDITADQFGAEPVVADAGRLAARYTANASQALLRRYEAHETGTVERFLFAINIVFHHQSTA